MRALLPIRLSSACVLAAALVAGSALTSADEAEPPELPQVGLARLREERSAWLGREVRFTLQLDRRVDVWNPWLTRFSPQRFRGLQAWDDATFLWEAEAYDDPATRLFVRRGTAAERALGAARRYRRFAVRAVVREVFLDEPWIELVGVEPLEEWVDEGTLVHALRGLALLDEEKPLLAANELERAAAPPRLPAHVKAELARLHASCTDAR